jgi:hypothetical protein
MGTLSRFRGIAASPAGGLIGCQSLPLRERQRLIPSKHEYCRDGSRWQANLMNVRKAREPLLRQLSSEGFLDLLNTNKQTKKKLIALAYPPGIEGGRPRLPGHWSLAYLLYMT